MCLNIFYTYMTKKQAQKCDTERLKNTQLGTYSKFKREL